MRMCNLKLFIGRVRGIRVFGAGDVTVAGEAKTVEQWLAKSRDYLDDARKANAAGLYAIASKSNAQSPTSQMESCNGSTNICKASKRSQSGRAYFRRAVS
jgi:hypothetical protein